MENVSENLESASALVDRTFQIIEEKFENKEKLTGVSTGLSDLDDMMGGLKEGTLIILGARPSMGKTAFVLNIARHAGVVEKQTVALFTFETASTQIMQRMLTSGTKLDSNRIRTGNLNKSDWDQIGAEMGHLRKAHIYFDDAYLTFDVLADSCRVMKRKVGLFLVIIDDLQQLAISEFDNTTEEKEPELMRRLKALAVELKISMIVTSQLSRAMEPRKNKRPTLNDFGRGACVTDIPDTVVLLYREEYYYPEGEQRGEAELIIARQKGGPTGTVELKYDVSTCNFSDKNG